ncbi:MAG TPA: FAD-binding oxidoreductase [Bryobacteraceae bacterium]|jgi:4-cresol dehydrogenase (hydroxylating)
MLAQAAISQWETVLGPENLITAIETLRSAAAATFPVNRRIPAILRPSTREQVQQSLRIATKFGIPVYPVSSGKNWGYGSGVPASDGCVLLDLSRMNRILDFNEDLGFVSVEPGVTQGQLFDFLRSRNSGLWLDATGSSPECSLIGNTLERGFGHTPYGDHFGNVCGFEVVLPTGETLETGAARFPGSPAAPVYRWGLGPSLDGLFTQSNLGVVTRMTFWLMPAPEYFQAFFFRCDDDAGMPEIVDALRRLRMSGTLRSSIHVGNDYKVLGGIQQYPWKETGGSTPLTPDLMAGFRQRLNFGAWNGSGGLYGTRAQVAEARRLLRRALTGKVSRLQFLDDKRLALATRFSRLFGMVAGWDLSRALQLVRPVFGLLKGQPSDRPLASAYWRKRTPPPESMNPDRDRCGLLWCSPVAPAEGGHAKILASLASEILLRHGFEPMLSITLITDRALICVISITYDREAPGEDDRAMSCYSELQRQLSAKGYVPYRLGIQSMGEMNAEGVYARFLDAIKRAADPADILAPGRYEAARVETAGGVKTGA